MYTCHKKRDGVRQKGEMNFVTCLVSTLAVLLLYDIKAVQCNQEPVPVYYPNRIVFTNDTKSFTVRVTRFICAETPYETSELLNCKTVLRRNRPTFFNVTVRIPEVLNTLYFQMKTFYRLNDYQEFPVNVIVEICAYFRNPSEDIFSRHVMSVMLETLPHMVHYCPHGNKTYNAVYWLEDKFFPKSVPAGDYRQDVWFRNGQNKTIFAYQAYFSVRRMGVLPSLIEW
ncbi:uncharacterized protein LOC118507011 [Anopheles stephensi]|uniref:uncharacterized protein LOC118507011 n=1 Tax=Anopheles stephensi TaxID=30069 RepID=UPI0016587514|nr:uncharacterized protein LOC118507011 [Anopheles stephensi]